MRLRLRSCNHTDGNLRKRGSVLLLTTLLFDLGNGFFVTFQMSAQQELLRHLFEL